MSDDLLAQVRFEPDERFTVDGKGDLDLHFDSVAREVRGSLVEKAQRFGVELASESLEWPAPVGRLEIDRTLAGLCVLETAVSRLLDAGDEVLAVRSDAIGLRSVDRFEVASIKKGRDRRGRRGRGSRARRRSSGADTELAGRLDEYEVTFKFRADAATTQLFLEKCRASAPLLLLRDGFKMKAGRDAADPLTVQGRLVGLSLRDDA